MFHKLLQSTYTLPRKEKASEWSGHKLRRLKLEPPKITNVHFKARPLLGNTLFTASSCDSSGVQSAGTTSTESCTLQHFTLAVASF